MIKVRLFFGNVVVLLITLVGMTACNSYDIPIYDNSEQQESLYGEWRLVGWNEGGSWFEVDTNYVSHQHLSIEFVA